MLRLKEVASQSETFSKRIAKQSVTQMIERMALAGHYCVVFSIDRPPLLAVGLRSGYFARFVDAGV